MKTRTEPKFSREPEEGLLSEHEERRIDGLAFKDETYGDVKDRAFYECTFTNITFTGEVRQGMFTDVIFDHCTLANCDFSESVMHRVLFRHCRMTGIDLTGSKLEDVTILDSHCGYANFNGSKWNRFLLEDCLLKEAGLSMCTFKSPEIRHCDFSGAEFLESSLQDFDLTTSVLDGATLDPSGLKGCIMNEEQAIACAKLFGIIVK